MRPNKEITDRSVGEHEHYARREQLPMWVVYRPVTTDYPGRWSARMHLSLPQPVPTEFIVIADSLDGVRAGLPKGLSRIPRMDGDVPSIEEVWL